MAFSYGFFNAKNLDRTYTAENFCDYLGSIICNGIQDNYSQCFELAKNNMKLTIGSGKAWIDGHYFISRACSHKNSIKNHSEHDNRKKNNIEFIVTSADFSKTL